jgi:glycosyltransferase involved in cell wall biosynthesis
MNDDALLTIAIPTRNRCEALGRVLAETCERIGEEAVQGKVRVLVFDDCSTDETEARIGPLARQHGMVEYVRSDARVGYDVGLLRCLQLASTKYVWTMNDHSSILPGVLPAILRELSDDLLYVYAPQKGELGMSQGVHSVSREALGFVNMSINTNIYNRARLIPYYQKHLPAYDGSWLVFHVANLDLLYETPQPEVRLLPFECSEYGRHMGKERARNSWSTNREQYVRTGYLGAKILAEMKTRHSISDEVYERVFDRRDWGLDACIAHYRLRTRDTSGRRFDSGVIEAVATHPTYNPVERSLIRGCLGGPSWQIPCYAVALAAYTLLADPRRVVGALRRLAAPRPAAKA